MNTIAIVGLGLIGGSLGLDLMQLGYPVVGIARRPETAQAALARGAVSQAGSDLALVAQADVVYLCTPLDGIVPIFKALRPHLRDRTVVTDVGSVKGAIVEAIEPLWPHFVGGHPMAGKAEAGLAVAEAQLFRHRPYVLTPTSQTPETALASVATLAAKLGANLYHCSPADHDRAVAWISHLPVLVSSCLIQSCQQEPDPTILHLAQALASSGFRDTSRVGGGVPELGTLMARYNRDALLHALTLYQQQLAQLQKTLVAEDWSSLFALFEHTQRARPAYLTHEPSTGQPHESGDQVGE